MLAAVSDAGEKWAAAIPLSFGPADGRAAAALAYNDARKVIRDSAALFTGTNPPPPWPAPPELQAAMKRVKVLADGFEVFVKQTPAQRWPRDTGKVGPALLREGRALYAAADKLKRTVAALPRLDKSLLPDPQGWIWIALAAAALVFVLRDD
jgi:hypothetical protein